MGQRGAGKTTLLLQRMKKEKEQSVYLTLDDIYFEANRLITTIDKLVGEGVKVFILDEVHRYEHWSRDLKSAYDNYPDIRLVVTGSSLLQVSEGKADLSRRSVIYNLPGLSFREFIDLEYEQKFDVVLLEELLKNHSKISSQIRDNTAIQDVFKNYLQYGYYPFFREGKQVYSLKLREITHLILDVDAALLEDLTHTTVRNMKKLMFVISQSVPFKPNISKLSERMGIPRNTILKLLGILDRAAVLQLLKSGQKGISYLQKPEKIYLGNTNLAYLFGNDKPDVGNLRETFFLSQLRVKHDVHASRFADFVVDDAFTFEVGGPSKTDRQIRDIPNAYIAADEIEGSIGNKIPLWLFGFLY